jgi:hypothetical protein
LNVFHFSLYSSLPSSIFLHAFPVPYPVLFRSSISMFIPRSMCHGVDTLSLFLIVCFHGPTPSLIHIALPPTPTPSLEERKRQETQKKTELKSKILTLLGD